MMGTYKCRRVHFLSCLRQDLTSLDILTEQDGSLVFLTYRNCYNKNLNILLSGMSYKLSISGNLLFHIQTCRKRLKSAGKCVEKKIPEDVNLNSVTRDVLERKEIAVKEPGGKDFGSRHNLFSSSQLS